MFAKIFFQSQRGKSLLQYVWELGLLQHHFLIESDSFSCLAAAVVVVVAAAVVFWQNKFAEMSFQINKKIERFK